MTPTPSTTRIEITPAAETDRAAVVRLLTIQLREHRVDISVGNLGAAVDGVLDDERRGFLLVAKDAGEVVGVAYVSFTWSLEHGGKSAWLEELYVVPERRAGGIGTAMLDRVLERARAQGCAAVDLEVDAEHERAARLYARNGFIPHTRARWVKLLRS